MFPHCCTNVPNCSSTVALLSPHCSVSVPLQLPQCPPIVLSVFLYSCPSFPPLFCQCPPVVPMLFHRHCHGVLLFLYCSPLFFQCSPTVPLLLIVIPAVLVYIMFPSFLTDQTSPVDLFCALLLFIFTNCLFFMSIFGRQDVANRPHGFHSCLTCYGISLPSFSTCPCLATVQSSLILSVIVQCFAIRSLINSCYQPVSNQSSFLTGL